MTATQLMADLARHGIRLEARGDRLRYTPQSAVTPDLADRMKANKPELLAILRSEAEFPTDVMEALRAADIQWAPNESPIVPTDSKSLDLGPDGRPIPSTPMNWNPACNAERWNYGKLWLAIGAAGGATRLRRPGEYRNGLRG